MGLWVVFVVINMVVDVNIGLGLWVDVCMAGVVGTIFEVVSGCLTDFVDGSFGATTIFLVNFDLV